MLKTEKTPWSEAKSQAKVFHVAKQLIVYLEKHPEDLFLASNMLDLAVSMDISPESAFEDRSRIIQHIREHAIAGTGKEQATDEDLARWYDLWDGSKAFEPKLVPKRMCREIVSNDKHNRNVHGNMSCLMADRRLALLFTMCSVDLYLIFCIQAFSKQYSDLLFP
jgi:hypothetical protein